MAFKNDMTTMYAMHDALRGELERLAHVTARPDDDPKHILRTAAGCEMFKTYQQVHHTTEDDMLWPAMRKALADGSHWVALLDAMEAEHSAIDPARHDPLNHPHPIPGGTVVSGARSAALSCLLVCCGRFHPGMAPSGDAHGKRRLIPSLESSDVESGR